MHKLVSMSPAGPIGTIFKIKRGRTIRRILLRKTRQHIYYAFDDENAMIVVQMVWGAQRGRPPRV